MTGKLRDYLLGSKFTVYTDNTPLAYVKESKLGVAQIRWLSEIALFDVDIKYRSGKLNQAADTLSHCPMTDSEILSNTESHEYETISYAVMCDDLSEVIKGEKLPLDLKRAVQIEISQQAPDSEKINVHSEMVDVLSRVTLNMMKEAQEEDIDISKTICYVKPGKKLMLVQIRKVKSRPVRRYLCQFDRLVFRQGVLHRVYKQNGAKYHQLIIMVTIINRVTKQWNVHYSWYVEGFIRALCSRTSQGGLKIISGVKLPRVHMLIQIQYRDQLYLTTPWVCYV